MPRPIEKMNLEERFKASLFLSLEALRVSLDLAMARGDNTDQQNILEIIRDLAGVMDDLEV